MKNLYRILVIALATSTATLISACKSPPAEPTQDEMRSAVERTMAGAGTGGGQKGELRVDNMIAGLSITIRDFEKVSCTPAVNKPGFVCDYLITTSMGYRSNVGTASGDAHAEAVNGLMSLLSGGRTKSGMREAVTARFVQANGQWLRMPN